MTQIVILII